MSDKITPRKEKLMLKVIFGEDELKEFSGQLARATEELCAAEEEKKAITAQFKERTESAKMTALALSRKINSGYDMRYVDCELKMDDPRVGEVTIIRLDTGEIVRTRPMTDEECQFKLDFDKQFDPPPAGEYKV